MKRYNQNNYPNKLGFGTTTIASHGCKLISFCMLYEMLTGKKIEPLTMNEMFKKDGCFSYDLLDDVKCAKSLGLEFLGKLTKDPKQLCIMEVDFSPSPGKQQHFVVYDPENGVIQDPWGGVQRSASKYTPVSYRLFKVKTMNKIEEWATAIKKHEGFYPGSASYRNNNPGNFRCSSLVMGEFGATKCVNNLAVFPTYEKGWAALKQFLIYACTDKLRNYKSTMTLLEFYQVYAPSSDNNNPLNYASAVANDLGVTINTKIGSFYAPVEEEKPKTIQDTTPAEKPLESPNLTPGTNPMNRDEYLEPKKQAIQAISDLNNLISTKMQGYKTFTGIAILFLGAIGFGDIISEGELAKVLDALMTVAGAAVAVYGRIVATKK